MGDIVIFDFFVFEFMFYRIREFGEGLVLVKFFKVIYLWGFWVRVFVSCGFSSGIYKILRRRCLYLCGFLV